MQSVISQNFREWRHVIVNDGGDKSVVDKLAEKYTSAYEGRLQVIHNPKSTGMEAASNIGIRSTESTYIAIHDDDDSWHEDFLSETVTYLNAGGDFPNIAGVVTDYLQVTEKLDKNKITKLSESSSNGKLADISLWQMAAGNLFPPIAFIYRRDAYEKIGGQYCGMYDESMPVLGDWEFNLRFLKAFNIGKIARPLANYHQRAGDQGSTIINNADKHLNYNLYLRNRELRNDMSENRIGLGFLMNSALEMKILKEVALATSNTAVNLAGSSAHIVNKLDNNEATAANTAKISTSIMEAVLEGRKQLELTAQDLKNHTYASAEQVENRLYAKIIDLFKKFSLLGAASRVVRKNDGNKPSYKSPDIL